MATRRKQSSGWLLAGLVTALVAILFLLDGPLGARAVVIEPTVVMTFEGKAKKVVLAECEDLFTGWRDASSEVESASSLGAYLECLEQLHYMGKISWEDHRARLRPVMTAQAFGTLIEGPKVRSSLKLFNRRLNRILNTRWRSVQVSSPVPAAAGERDGGGESYWIYREISKSTHAEYDRVRVIQEDGQWLAADWESVPRLLWTVGGKGKVGHDKK